MPTVSQEPLPTSAVEVCSRAMVLVGLEKLSSFNEIDRDEVIVASQIYEVVVADCLAMVPWGFASGQQQLENDPSPPLDRYEQAWHMPVIDSNAPVFIETVRLNGIAQVYEIMANRIYCSVDPAEALI